VDSLTNKHRGVVLMHGLPGTGKSNYIKYLASLVPDKQFIYVPLTYIAFLGSPDAVSFLSRHTNSIFVIEDCEQYIKSRDGGSGSAVADILNLSDGILSDLAKCQIICTFNSNIGEVDKALLREGRLIGEHYFDKITVDGEEMTLAEYFNQDSKAVRKVQEKPKFGFI
jgi:energy-coupling factor transporter ATP-binding protein EcfA2